MLPFGVSLILGLLLIPIVRRLSFRFGKVSQPRPDRWHQKPTPMLGGVGIFLAFAGSVLFVRIITQTQLTLHWGLIAGVVCMFAIGVIDDFKPLTPSVKMALQILAAGIVVFSGYRTGFFNNAILNILLSMIWLVGITNAINLMDNMDGLAGGISLITAGLLCLFFWRVPGQEDFLMLALALAGAILSFLIFNFPPASIFMGDSGSLFLGFTLAALAIARKPQASNVFAVMSVPTLIFLLPILDTAFVTFTRILRGQSPAQGGRDHTSHRLVAFGLSERQTVVILYALALGSGVVGAMIESVDYTLGLVLIPIVVLSFALLAAYLGRVKVIEKTAPKSRSTRPLTTIMVELTYRRSLLEIALDFFIISIAYYLAFLVENEFTLDEPLADLLLSALPVALASGYFSFFVFRVYRGVWEYIGVYDLIRLAGAALSSSILCGIVLSFYDPVTFSSSTLFLFTVFLFIGLAGSRSSFRVFDQIFSYQAQLQDRKRNEQASKRVLIYGGGKIGEITLRWLQQNPELGYQIIGIVDDEPYKWGRQIHGIAVLGGSDQLAEIIQQSHPEGIILASENIPNRQKLIEESERANIFIQAIQMGLEDILP